MHSHRIPSALMLKWAKKAFKDGMIVSNIQKLKF